MREGSALRCAPYLLQHPSSPMLQVRVPAVHTAVGWDGSQRCEPKAGMLDGKETMTRNRWKKPDAPIFLSSTSRYRRANSPCTAGYSSLPQSHRWQPATYVPHMYPALKTWNQSNIGTRSRKSKLATDEHRFFEKTQISLCPPTHACR